MITSLIRKSFSGLFQLDTGVELTSQRSLAVVFLSFLVAQLSLIATRFNWIFIDADQLVIAEQARWISMGLFFEPYFYGQNYLFPIDAYLSSILVFLGVNPLSAVQFCTLFFFYAPLSAAIVLFRGDRFRLLVALGLFFILLPFKFLIVAQMARAFTTITSLASIAIAVYLWRGNKTGWQTSLICSFVFGFCLGAFKGAVLLAPLLVLVDGKKRILHMFLGSASGFFFVKMIGSFYLLNPSYIIHPEAVVKLTLDDLIQNVSNPFIRQPLLQMFLPGFLISIILLKISNLSIFGKIRVASALVGLLGLLGLMLSTAKIRDFMPDSPFYAVERMFVAVPFFFAVVIVHLSANSRAAEKSHSKKLFSHFFQHSSRWMIAISVILIAGFSLQIRRLDRYLLKNAVTLASSPSPAQVVSFDSLQNRCLVLQQRFSLNGGGFLVLNGRDDALVYGCSALMGFRIVQNDYERRTWLARYYEQQGLNKIVYNP